MSASTGSYFIATTFTSASRPVVLQCGVHLATVVVVAIVVLAAVAARAACIVAMTLTAADAARVRAWVTAAAAAEGICKRVFCVFTMQSRRVAATRSV